MSDNKIINNIVHQEVTSTSHFHGLPVMANAQQHVFTEILNKYYRELTLICARYSRVLVVRLDLHPASTGGLAPREIDIPSFRKSIVRKLERKYKSKVAFGWVRESGRQQYNNGWHWHWWFAVKCDVEYRPHIQQEVMFKEIISTWQEKVGGRCARNNMAGWFYLRRQDFDPHKRLNDQNQIADGSDSESDIYFNRDIIYTRALNRNLVLGGVVDECFYALSYMAKVYSKVRTEKTKGVRIFGCSNLNTEDEKAGRSEAIQGELSKIHKWLQKPIVPINISQKHIDEYEARKAEWEKERTKRKKEDAEWVEELEKMRLEDECESAGDH